MERCLAGPEIQQQVRDEVISTVALADQFSREFNVRDQGIDMEIEFTDDSHEATGAKLYLQLKSEDSCLRERKGHGGETFTMKEERDARYWMAQAFPVLLVIRNSEGEVRWMEVREWLKRTSDDSKQPVKQTPRRVVELHRGDARVGDNEINARQFAAAILEQAGAKATQSHHKAIY
jgi:hypothetical protein